jgi:hypothetical protein
VLSIRPVKRISHRFRLIDCRVEVYTGSRGGKKPTYKRQTNYGPNDEVPLLIGGKVGRIPVKELLL